MDSTITKAFMVKNKKIGFDTLQDAYNFFSLLLPDPEASAETIIRDKFIIADQETEVFAIKNRFSEEPRWDISI